MVLSIIIPLHNSEKFIERCLNSIVNQNIFENDVEVIIINDHSSDRSVEIVNSYTDLKNLNLYNSFVKGPGAARNLGIDLAKGEYIYFIDSDDYLASNSLAIPLKIAQEQKLDVIGFQTKVTYSGNLSESQSKYVKTKNIISNKGDFVIDHPNHRVEAWWYILRNEYLKRRKYRFLEEKFLEDVIFTFNVLLNAERSLFLNIDVHRYVQHKNSIMNTVNHEHLKKVVNDSVTLILNMNRLINNCKEQNFKAEVIDHLTSWRNRCLFHSFFPLIKSSLSKSQMNGIISQYKKINAYPIGPINNVTYRQRKIKAAHRLFNNKQLFFLILPVLRYAYRRGFVKLL